MYPMHVPDSLGQLFMVGLPHPILDHDTRLLLHKLQPGGVILFRRNYTDLVALLGCALARGLREGGVIPCGKHFPGHGATRVDSHDDLPRDERAEDELVRIDLYPFRHAIAERVDMLMTAHILYPALDPDLPATLSPLLIEGL